MPDYSFSQAIYAVVKQIPPGRVATYLQIAQLVASKKHCRAVGNALHRNPSQGSIPCHRVVNAQGRLSPNFAFGGLNAQQALLEAEGITVAKGKVDLKKYGWKPTENKQHHNLKSANNYRLPDFTLDCADSV